MKWQSLLFLLSLGLLFTACQPDEDPLVDTDVPDINQGGNEGGGTDNPPANLVELGRLLFWDPILSGTKEVSCATCHHPDFGYSDGRALSLGVNSVGLGPNRRLLSNDPNGFVKRNSQTIINTAFNGMREDGQFDPERAPMFWDNRERSLEAQALGPLHSFEEMRGHAFSEDLTIDSIVARLTNNAQYRALFAANFGANRNIDGEAIGTAIAAFERTLTATNSPFDRFQAGDQNAMTQQQLRGMATFNRIGCDDCHSGSMFSDYQLHTLGIPDHPELLETDAGANGNYNFRTPTLRNLTETGPYFHNGLGGDLEATIRFYITARNFANNRPQGPGNGLRVNPNVQPNQIDRRVRGLGNFNNNDIQDIIAFIQALNDPNFDREIPASVPSGLPVGGN